MNNHKKLDLESIDCPFAIQINKFDWNEAKIVVSFDYESETVIVEMKNGKRFLVNVPKILYEAIYKSVESNFIEQDLGFNDLT